SGVQYTINTDFISNSKLITGIDHKYSTLKDTKLGSGGADNTIISNQRVNIIGSFAQYEIKFGDLKLGTGLRYDSYNISNISGEHNSIKGNVPAPRANILYDITSNIQFRASYASGYRAPQIFDEDLHIETSGARRITHRNSEDLKQETSNSYNSSFKYNNIFGTVNPVQIELVAEGFYTRLIDPFANEYTAIDDEGNVEYTRINTEDDAIVYGGNFEANIAFSKDFIIQTGFTYQKSEYEKAQQWGEEETSTAKEFMKSPNDYGFLTVNYSPLKNFSAALTGTYTGKMLVPHFGLDPETIVPAEMEALENNDVIAGEKLEISDRFLNMGLKLAYTIEIDKRYKVEWSAGMQNIMNQTQHDHDSGIYRDAGYIYGPRMARAVTFGLKIGNF
ncbi:MAG: TonB-dependent receptor, partial [Bacteroidota bacterium]|nr:TonB-dependent receptor [Bacteroidota bacterium]